MALVSQFVETCGYRTHYIEMGEGRPLILVHGGGAGADARGNWEGLAMPLFAGNRRVIALDMVGFGDTLPDDHETFDYSPEARVLQLGAFIEALGLGPVDVVGNSMGGRTAVALASDRPELIDRLVLMGSAGLDHGMGGGLQALVTYDFTYAGMERIVEALTHDGFVADPAMVQYRLDLSCRDRNREAFKRTMGQIKERGGLWLDEARIAKVKHRALVVNGKGDKVVSVAQAVRYLELLDNSTGVLLPHCGHWAMIEHPQRFASIVRAFLDERF